MHPELLNNSTFLRYYQQWQRSPESIVFAALAEYFLRYRMIDEADEICRHGLERFPNLVSGRLVMAKIFIARENWDEALTELHHVLSLQPEQAEALTLMKQVQEILQPVGPIETFVENTAAITELPKPENFDVAAHISPEVVEKNSVEPLENLAELSPTPLEKAEKILPPALTRPQAQDNQDAPEEDDAGIEVLPSRWKTLTMAQILLAQGHARKARQIYLAILARDPQNEAAKAALADLHIEPAT